MPAPTSAGRFGIARTIGSTFGHRRAKSAIRTPAMIDSSTGCCVSSAVRMPSSTFAATCGFTANTTTAAPSIAA
jgi:hypothetical protein